MKLVIVCFVLATSAVAGVGNLAHGRSDKAVCKVFRSEHVGPLPAAERAEPLEHMVLVLESPSAIADHLDKVTDAIPRDPEGDDDVSEFRDLARAFRAVRPGAGGLDQMKLRDGRLITDSGAFETAESYLADTCT